MKIVIPTCDKYIGTIHAHVHFLRKFWPDCPYEILVAVGGSGPVPKAESIDARIEYLGKDEYWASNFLKTHEQYLQDDELFILFMDDLIPAFVDPSRVQNAIDTMVVDDSINQIRLAEKWVTRQVGTGPVYYGDKRDYVHMRTDRWLYSNKATLWRSSVHRGLLKPGERAASIEGICTGRLRTLTGCNLGVTKQTIVQMNWVVHQQQRKNREISTWVRQNW